jgi:hypothetical protein
MSHKRIEQLEALIEQLQDAIHRQELAQLADDDEERLGRLSLASYQAREDRRNNQLARYREQLSNAQTERDGLLKSVVQPPPVPRGLQPITNANASQRTMLHTLTGHTDAVIGVVWSPRGGHLASASADKTVRVWDVRDE